MKLMALAMPTHPQHAEQVGPVGVEDERCPGTGCGTTASDAGEDQHAGGQHDAGDLGRRRHLAEVVDHADGQRSATAAMHQAERLGVARRRSGRRRASATPPPCRPGSRRAWPPRRGSGSGARGPAARRGCTTAPTRTAMRAHHGMDANVHHRHDGEDGRVGAERRGRRPGRSAVGRELGAEGGDVVAHRCQLGVVGAGSAAPGR